MLSHTQGYFTQIISRTNMSSLCVNIYLICHCVVLAFFWVGILFLIRYFFTLVFFASFQVEFLENGQNGFYNFVVYLLFYCRYPFWVIKDRQLKYQENAHSNKFLSSWRNEILAYFFFFYRCHNREIKESGKTKAFWQ